SSWKGRPCGSWGDAAGFSLHPLKRVNAWGDGGVITSNEDDVAEKIRNLRNHGIKDRNTVTECGYNARLDTIQAGVAQHVMDGLDVTLAKVNVLSDRLERQLQGIAGIVLEPIHAKAYTNRYLFTFLAEERDMLIAELAKSGIDAKAHYP